MLRLSAVARHIQPSATMAAAARARQLRAQGVPVLDFSLGEPDFPTPVHIRAAADEAMRRGQTRYTPANGTPELRAAVAQRYKDRYGLTYSPDEVLITSGAKHA